MKSFQGEQLRQAEVGPVGVVGDRRYVFLHRGGREPHLSAKLRPFLLQYTARYGTDEVEITAPGGTRYNWDEQLLERIREQSGLDLELYSYPADSAVLTAMDDSPLLLATESTLGQLEALMRRSVDMLRFRPNFVIRPLEGQLPLSEADWIGRIVQIGGVGGVGGVRLEVSHPCERCSMVGVDPGDGSIDPSVLKQVAAGMDSCFGVYARVLQPGVVRVDNPVLVE